MSIEIKNISHVYQAGTPNESTAVRDVSLTINEGEFLGIIGHTGSGKSTLVQHLNGLIRPTSGEVVVDGISTGVKGADLKEIRKKVGLVFQYPEHQLFEETVEKDVAFGPLNMGFPEKEIKKRVRRSLEETGLNYNEIKDKSPFSLSGGQKRRVAIASVLAMSSSYLVLDEPTAGLDPLGRDEILNQISALHKRLKNTIVLVSHNMDDVARYADRIAVMHQGGLRMAGTPAEVFSRGIELREMGLDIPTATEILLRLREKGLDVRTDIMDIGEAKKEIAAVLKKGQG